MFRKQLSAEEIQYQRDFYSQCKKDAKARGETDVAEYYASQLASLPKNEPSMEEKRDAHAMYSQYYKDAKARGEHDVAEHYKQEIKRFSP